MPQQKTYLRKKHQNNSPKKKVHKKKVNAEEIEDKKPSVFSNNLKKVLSYWHYWSLIPLLIIIGVVPLIVYAKIIELTPLEELNWTGGVFHLDFFNYYKAYWLIILTIALLMITGLLIVLKKIKLKKPGFLIPLSIFVFFSALSTFFALDRTVALRGFMEMFQGFYVLTSYALLIIIIYQLVEKQSQVKLIIGALIFLGIMVGIIGYYQYIGKDPIVTEFGLKLILPKSLESISDELSSTFQAYDIYATMGNTNFVGSYAALMIPLAFVLYLYSKKLIYQLFNVIFLGLMLLVGYGSNSRAGIIGIIVGLLMIIIVFRRMFVTRPFKILFPFVLMITVGIVLNVETDGKVINEFQSINLFKAIDEAETYAENQVFITRLEIENDTLYLDTEEEGIMLKWINNGLWPYTIEGEILEVTLNGRNVTFNEEKFQNFRIQIFEDQNAFKIYAYGKTFDLYATSDGLRIHGNGNFLEIPSNPQIFEPLDKLGTLFSNRAFIWSRSLPLLSNYFIIGSGPDNYPLAYPQNDFAGKLNFMGLFVIIDKPHNMYLQIGINTGVVSLLSLLVVFAIYIVQSIKLFFNRFELNYLNYIGVSCFLSIVAYLSAGLFNDQRVSVAPLFYVILGLGLVINRMIINHEEFN